MAMSTLETAAACASRRSQIAATSPSPRPSAWCWVAPLPALQVPPSNSSVLSPDQVTGALPMEATALIQDIKSVSFFALVWKQSQQGLVCASTHAVA